MKRFFYVFLIASINLYAQGFLVEKVSGTVNVLKGTSEKYESISTGDKLNGNDLIITDNNSFIQLNKNGSRFILQSNSALGLNYLKEISINDFLLALAMEEIRKVPKEGGNGNSKNTAVYGEEIKSDLSSVHNENLMGIKKLNGAKQLAENGYKESAVLVAKETYRKYPSTKNKIDERIYFADILVDLTLYSEAFEEFNEIRKAAPNNEIISNKIEKLKIEIEN